jgi:hypothetical protein
MRNEYMIKYRKIVTELIEESYPLLRNKKIRIREYGIFYFPWYFITTGYSGYRLIGINKKTRKYDDLVVRGLLAHELCHVETVEKHLTKNMLVNIIGLICYGGKYLISSIIDSPFSKRIERETDIETIKKGYGKELCAMANMREREFPNWKLSRVYKRGYLKLEEIKYYMEQFDKNT